MLFSAALSLKGNGRMISRMASPVGHVSMENRLCWASGIRVSKRCICSTQILPMSDWLDPGTWMTHISLISDVSPLNSLLRHPKKSKVMTPRPYGSLKNKWNSQWNLSAMENRTSPNCSLGTKSRIALEILRWYRYYVLLWVIYLIPTGDFCPTIVSSAISYHLM